MKKINAPLFQELLLEKGVIKEQVYHALRNAIVEERLPLGSKIPSTRALAEMMSISRNSVIAGYDRLADEGYIVTLKGAGTFVAQSIPDSNISNGFSKKPQKKDIPTDGPLNADIARVRNLWSEEPEGDERNPLFCVGVGCTDLVPHGIWGRLLGQVWKESRYELGLHTSSQGFLPLRRAISHYIQSTRGVNCVEDNIIIVNGIQQAMSITARALLSKGDEVWLDDPGYKGARGVFMSTGALVRPVRVDEEGMDVSDGIRRFPLAKLAYVVPSDQYPLGGTLSLSRRRELLDWADTHQAWIFEDDYNSEFRYADRSVQALQGLDTQQRVIYAGTFSKMMYPEFRIGFLVVPPGLKEQFVVTKYLADLSTGYLEQAVLARFIEEGHYARHVRRVRKACYERRTAVVKAIQRHLSGKMTVQQSDSGVHIVCWLHNGLTGHEVEVKARQLGMGIQSLSHYYHGETSREGILIGFANHPPQAMVDGIRRLAEVI
ncbi:MocR-like pyridoxine biosynthesis transcription factor PdxR [Yokenella regensburgei]|jgi:GntR family transcriptional regulator/MocR family aminotransferase|uniref:HTH-type transcriptional regulatory protein gabR n=1 Tax=Yokenella regensburgei TaxID=158877 RepID=A0AB38FSK8_9ENTR|nr:PLP-dependent aminotransferase family protein [Yokenella regensburgei]KFD19899.1 GntR family transcriptional regulator/aspartate aminotransferase [Yokenella regensburgei ATCC 49455]SQA60519.1 HTH-type transcriptional regulatory protein gabR [Yokenella regensburgei]SQA67336.1 HTH-type transcriptional regulatory protein gabR [Yokenella regensburgei]SUQ05770.1 HTH-type transcriptional regulatory protein gabR [Yokenella regensburgei]